MAVSTVAAYRLGMQQRPTDIADGDNPLDLARHAAKRRLLAEVAACNKAGIEPSKALVVRLAMRGRRHSGHTRSRWYVLMDELRAAGYLTGTQTVAGWRLSITKDGTAALESSK